MGMRPKGIGAWETCTGAEVKNPAGFSVSLRSMVAIFVRSNSWLIGTGFVTSPLLN